MAGFISWDCLRSLVFHDLSLHCASNPDTLALVSHFRIALSSTGVLLSVGCGISGLISTDCTARFSEGPYVKRHPHILLRIYDNI